MKHKAFWISLSFATAFFIHFAVTILLAYLRSKNWVGASATDLIKLYLVQQDYFIGLSYSVSVAFTLYALLLFLSKQKTGIGSVLSGISLTGLLCIGGCFLTGCCGSPMLPIYLALFGSTFLGFAKPITFVITIISVAIGVIWLKKKKAKICCDSVEFRNE